MLDITRSPFRYRNGPHPHPTHQPQRDGGHPNTANLSCSGFPEMPPSGHTRGWGKYTQLHPIQSCQVSGTAVNPDTSVAGHGGQRPHPGLRYLVAASSGLDSGARIHSRLAPFTSLRGGPGIGRTVAKTSRPNNHELPDVNHDFLPLGPTYHS